MNTKHVAPGLARIAIQVSLAAMAAGIAASPAAAQSGPPTNVVSICSGVSLPRSAVTGIMAPVVAGVVAPLQNDVNGLLSITPILPPLSIDVAGLLNTAASGQNIRLQAVDTNGNLIGPGAPCQAQATGYTLADQGGVAIGGNGITGLGITGQTATAGTLDAVAIGNNAGTSGTAGAAIAIGRGAGVGAGALGSIALGASASALGAGSVAIGAGAVASRGVPEFSIGAPGAERILTNVAAGTLATDAANTGQVAVVAGNLATLADRAVQYDDATRAVATLGGAGGTRLTNLADAALTPASSDAVAGRQLYATNAGVAANTTAITNLTVAVGNGSVGPVRYSAPGTPTLPNGGVQTNDVTLVGASPLPVGLHNVAPGVVAAGSLDAVNGAQLAAVQTAAAGAAANAVAYDVTPGGVRTGTVTLSGSGGAAVRITNAADGVVAAGSTDLVTGNQLAATNARLTTAETGLAAVGAQTAAIDGRVTANTGAIGGLTTQVGDLTTQVTGNTAAIGGLSGQVAGNTSAIGALATQVAGNATAIGGLATQVSGIDARVTANAGAIDALGTQVANGAIGPVRYSNAATPTNPNGGIPSNDVTLVGAAPGPVGLHDVAAGVVAAGSTDAVNGSQLAAVQAAGANAVSYDVDANGARTNAVTLSGGVAAAPVRIANVADGAVATGSSDAVTGNQLAATNAAVSTAQGTANTALTVANGAQGTANTALANAATAQGAADGARLLAATAQSTALAAQTTAGTALALGQNSVQYDDATHSGVTLGGTGASVPVALHNVAAGTATTDAVNVGQLQTGMQNAITQANGYTDRRLASISFDLKSTRRDSFAGSATALAAAGLPQAYTPGAGMIALGGGTYGGESAIAIGFSKAFSDGHTVVRFAGSRDTRGNTGASGGVGYQF